MKQIYGRLMASALIATASMAALAQAPTEYRKKGGVAEIGTPSGSTVPFSISSSVGQNTCNLEGMATIIDSNRAAFTSNDSGEKCVAVLNLSGKSLKVTTKDCASYCGAGADGSMDGTYQKR